MKTVNIYYIFDASVKIRGNTVHRIEENISRISRALGFAHCKTKLHIIGYRDRAFYAKPRREHRKHEILRGRKYGRNQGAMAR